jgi:photosystem II stability/assembly factor-like uncharacterized protein
MGRLARSCTSGAWFALALSVGVVPAMSREGAPTAEDWAIEAPLAAESLLLDVAQREGRMVAVGERGHVLVSEDGGRAWTQAKVPTRAMLTGVFMHDRQLGWAVGHDQVALRTTDGGRTWERVHYAPEMERPLLDVWFADARRGLALGAYGELLATRDCGATWEPRPVNGGDDFHLNNIALAPDGAVYLAAEAGHLYRSDDGGETWQALTSPYQGSFFGILPLSDGQVLAYGLRGHLFRSADRGATWTRLDTDTEETLTSALELGPGRFVVGGMAGTLLWASADGATIRKQELPDRKAIVALAAADATTLVLFGEGGTNRIEIPR